MLGVDYTSVKLGGKKSFLVGFFQLVESPTKWMNKPNQTKTDTQREQSSGYERGRHRGLGKKGKRYQLYGDGWKLNFWW